MYVYEMGEEEAAQAGSDSLDKADFGRVLRYTHIRMYTKRERE